MSKRIVDDDPFSVFSMKRSRKPVVKEEKEAEESEVKVKDEPMIEEEVIKDPQPEELKAEHEPVVGEEEEDKNDDKFLSSFDRSRIVVHTIETLEVCTHEVAVPPSFEYKPIKKTVTKPAKEYKFILDPFQKEAILCIENNESVLVSAHTSAGKTVVAEYSIAQSLNAKQRVIYTTPIKALSNQKYREFYDEFKDVGLVTGDVTINPSASCLIMTTEILRSMLYHGSEIMREVSWVIFDEIHYMRDKERGVVWEETLILLPDNVHYVFLSATIPNAREFAEWVAYIHSQPCHVVYTDFRPTPLQHYVFPSGGDGIHLVVNEDGEFLEENFRVAMKCVGATEEEGGPKGGGAAVTKNTNRNKRNDPACFKVVKMVMERNLAPAIVFSFSKKECELYAMQMAKLDFLTKDQKRLVDEVFENAMGVLSDEDRHLPQVENVLPLLRRGIGIHHGGLLPILKETIEVLFAEGLVKALFATETFAMGLNMPARTVVFTNARKFDGRDHRYITSGEYIQMSGRAGRRGLDDKGIVILMVDEEVSPSVGRDLLKGAADPLNSAFHLTFNMILNLLRVDEINPEYMMERSFFQFQNVSKIPRLVEKLEKARAEAKAVAVERETELADYAERLKALDEDKAKYCHLVFKPRYVLPYLKPGRLIKMLLAESGGDESDWGVIINHKTGKYNPRVEDPDVTVDVLLPGGPDLLVSSVTTHSYRNIRSLSSVRINAPTDVRSKDNLLLVSKLLKKIKERFPDGVPELDPVADYNISIDTVVDLHKSIKEDEARLKAHPVRSPSLEWATEGGFASALAEYKRKQRVEAEAEALAAEVEKAKSLLQMDELKRRKRVLRRLGYCSDSDVISVKGRVACEVNSIDELVMTELLFSGHLNDMSTDRVLAVLSCFVCDERTNEQPKLSDDLCGALRAVREIGGKVFRAYKEAKLDLEEDEYLGRFKPTLMEVVASWVKGASFAQVCQMTDMFEGSIIRCLRRLEELLRQLVMASKTMGSTDMEVKFSQGINSIKRDIVFAASLYL